MTQTPKPNDTNYDGIAEKLPHVFRIEPSSSCNLRCLHCPTGILPSKDRGVMSWETFAVVMREVKAIRPNVAVLYHGGEPFINKHIFDMIRELKSAGVAFIKTTTNGMLLDTEMLEQIVESGLECIEFSLDGKSQEENDEIRRGCSYETVSILIKRLIALKRDMRSNTPEVYIANCQIATDAEPDPKNPQLPSYIAEDFSAYPNEIKYKVRFAMQWPGFPLDASKYRLSAPINTEQSRDYCEHPMELITIRSNGDVIACCYDITSCYVLGNIKEAPIERIWNNERYRTLRRSIKSRQYLPLCQNCEVVRPQRLLIRGRNK